MVHNFEQGLQHYTTAQPQQLIIERASFFNWNKAADDYIKIYQGL